jgi:hypothetical protein
MRTRIPRSKIRKSVRRVEPSQKISRENERKTFENSQKKQILKLINGDI